MPVLRRRSLVLSVVAAVVAAVLVATWWWGIRPLGSSSSATGTDQRQARGAAAPPGAASGPRTSSPAAPAGIGSAAWTRRENARRGSTAWRIPPGRVAGPQALAGYADHVSVLPGGRFRLFVSSRLGPVEVRAFRLGWYHGDGARLVWRSRPFDAGRQAPPRLLAQRTVVAAWKPSLTVSTKGWPPGTYLLLLRARDGREKYVPITVRSTTTSGDLVLVNAVTTYEAYNDWGGYSLYRGTDGHRAYRVSFDRPYDGDGATQLLNFEAATIQLAQRQDLPLAYETSLELDRLPHLLDHARGVVSLGHDEYWTVPMRRHVEAARDHGANVAFLGANADYWRVRFAPGLHGSDRMMVGYKADAALADPVHDAPDTTAMWRQPPDPDPENSLTGQLYECFPAHGALIVRDPGFFLFHGTNARVGSSYAGLVGTEIDRAYPIVGTPRDLQVVAHSPVACDSTGPTFADLTYYTAPSGAGVVDTGTMLWVRGLHGPSPAQGIDARTTRFARRVTANLFLAMAAGPMGRAHPAHGDLAALRARVSTRSGTGGPYTLPRAPD